MFTVLKQTTNVKNPIGLKCGPTLKPEELVELCNILNPDNEPGRITLISRFGADSVEKYLPKLIKVKNPAPLRLGAFPRRHF